MKRWFACLLAVLLPWTALAESDGCWFETVGQTSDDRYIRRCVLPTGQPVYYVSVEELEHRQWEDVNFDGHDDLVLYTAIGASNFFCEFFVFDPETGLYERAVHRAGENGLCNYQLKDGYVVSHEKDGYAEHDISVLRWENGVLRQVRRASCRQREETTFEGRGMTTTVDLDAVEVQVVDFTTGVPNGEVIWRRTVATDDETAMQQVYEEEQAVLWQGL